MIFLLSITVATVFLTYLGYRLPSLVTVNKRTKKLMPNKYVVVLIIALFTFFAAIRSNVGDTSMYMHSFEIYKLDYSEVFKFNGMFSFIFNNLLKNIWNDPQIMIIATSLIIYPCIIWRFYKNSVDPIMTMVLFVFSVSYVSTMNGIRQYLVSAVLFALYPWIIKQINNKKYLTIILLVLFLSLFHSSVLILIPVFLIANKSPFNGKNFLIYLLIIVGILSFNLIMPALFTVMEETGVKYAEYSNAGYGTLSVNPLRILFNLLPTLLYLYLRKNKRLKNSECYFIGNMTIFNSIFMLLSYYGAVYARFCIYFEFYPMLIYPILIKSGFKKESQKYVKIILYMIYFIFMYYQIQISWGGFILKSNWLGLAFGG